MIDEDYQLQEEEADMREEIKAREAEVDHDPNPYVL